MKEIIYRDQAENKTEITAARKSEIQNPNDE